ncbi:hypothetical protein KIL84_022348 [Mauremys mutica]|uniref:Uncharacterized protein n=1 Tax=Mauremys mutica TaxID=74926 RepID=A0A9D3XAI6_9SAUR|nr:hypothetical protein KIL84_022348 [Mauremys mutica]
MHGQKRAIDLRLRKSQMCCCLHESSKLYLMLSFELASCLFCCQSPFIYHIWGEYKDYSALPGTMELILCMLSCLIETQNLKKINNNKHPEHSNNLGENMDLILLVF